MGPHGERPSATRTAITIRPAERADIDALVSIEDAAFPADRLSRRSLLRLIGSRSAIVLAGEADGRLVGSAVLLLRSYSRRARLYSLAVRPGDAGRGFGSTLLAAAERAAAIRGSEALTLEVRDDNSRARRLYERSGYALIGRSPDYYSDGETALHFRKSLSAAGTAADGQFRPSGLPA